MPPFICSIFALAESGSGFNFSGFQATFHEAWNFVFPNLVMLALCCAVARFVGQVPPPWRWKVWKKVEQCVTELGSMLRKSRLIGSKILPGIVLVIVGLTALNVFNRIRITSYNFLPPQIICRPTALYQRLAQPYLLVQVFAREPSVSSPDDLYRCIFEWEERVRNDKTLAGGENVAMWVEEQNEWIQHSGDVRLLAAVALASCIAGLRQKRWVALLRLLVVGIVLSLGYVYCLTKELYAKEQTGFAVISSLDRHYREDGDAKWCAFLRSGLNRLDANKDWFVRDALPSTAWWEFRWVDSHFYERAIRLLRGTIDMPTGWQPGVSQYDVERLKLRLELDRKLLSEEESGRNAAKTPPVPRAQKSDPQNKTDE